MRRGPRGRGKRRGRAGAEEPEKKETKRRSSSPPPPSPPSRRRPRLSAPCLAPGALPAPRPGVKRPGERQRGAAGRSGRRRRSRRRRGSEGRSLHCVGADARPRKSSRSGLFPFLLLLLLRLPGEKDRGRQRRCEAAAAPEEGRLLLFGAHARVLFFVRGERREKREEMKAKRTTLEEEVRSSFVASFFTSKKGKKTEAPYFAPPLLARTASSSFGSASLQSPTSP